MPEPQSTKPAFEHLVEEHSREIFSYLWRMTQNTEDAEDLLQDTFLRAYKAYPKLEHHQYLRAWLYKIATNVAHSFHTRNQHRNTNTDFEENEISASTSTADLVQVRLDLQAVKTAVEALPKKQRAALIMHKFQALSYREISDALDIQEDAARANVYQAMKKLRTQFAEKEV